MSKILAAVLAFGVVTAAVTPSFAFNPKTFWKMQEAMGRR